MSSKKKPQKNANTDNNDNTGLVSVADVTENRDNCHNKNRYFPDYGNQKPPSDEKSANFPPMRKHPVKIS
jgi:hypothetical protein